MPKVIRTAYVLVCKLERSVVELVLFLLLESRKKFQDSVDGMKEFATMSRFLSKMILRHARQAPCDEIVQALSLTFA